MSHRFILCEKTPRWAPSVRAALPCALRIAETRSVAGCEAALDEFPESLVAIEISSANLEAALAFMTRCRDRHPRAVTVALLAADAHAAADLVREAGAVDVLRSVIEVNRLAALARRHSRLTHRQPANLHELVAERLPWPAHASPSASTSAGDGQ